MTPLDWSHPVADVSRAQRSYEREATGAERIALAKALAIPSVERLVVRYRLDQPSNGRYRLAGTLSATVTQSCVVSLEPIVSDIEQAIDVEFRPDADSAAPVSTDSDEAEILALPDYEPIEDNALAAGRVVFETLGAALDPYPRKPGATFDWTDEAGARAVSPFAALARLKKQDP